MAWIRVETNVAENPKVHAFASDCGISAESSLGFLVRVWGKVAEHRPFGVVADVSDQTIEDWAVWRGKPGCFAQHFKKRFVRDGEITGWRELQGKLVERAAKDRERKVQGNSREVPHAT